MYLNIFLVRGRRESHPPFCRSFYNQCINIVNAYKIIRKSFYQRIYPITNIVSPSARPFGHLSLTGR